jgi:hypothetical protein
MSSQQFVFKGKGASFYAAQTRHLRGFEDVVQWFAQREGVRSRGEAITLARKTRPNDYNTWMKSGRRHQMAAEPVQVMSMRTRSGAPLVQFRGL